MKTQKPLLFSLFEERSIASKLAMACDVSLGEVTMRSFPDQETYLQIQSDVRDREVIVICNLYPPDHKLVPLSFFAKTVKALGAKRVGLVTPYLPYMRQDKRFHPGESISAQYFAELLSQTVDWVVTVEPHLHRYALLDDIFTIPTRIIHVDEAIARWVKKTVKKPILIGPDSESRQWIQRVADILSTPQKVFRKTRLGDHKVTLEVPSLQDFKQHTPVILDDIISTGGTMLKVVQALKKNGMSDPVCICVHGLFVDQSYSRLCHSGIKKLVTCNTIEHESNVIDVYSTIARELVNMGVVQEKKSRRRKA